MKHFIAGIFAALALIALVITSPAFAGTQSNQLDNAGWGKLSESQRADIMKKVADMSDDNGSIKGALSAPGKVAEWVDVGSKIGQAFGGAAKEVGVAVNDFVKTPVGQWTMAIIVWKFMGAAIVHVAGGILVLVVGLSFIFYMISRARTVTRRYDTSLTDSFGRSRLKDVTKSELDGGYVSGFTACAAIVILAAIITTFSF